MTHTQKAIEDAVKGGWKYSCTPTAFNNYGDGMNCDYAGCNDEWSVWTRQDNGSSICPPHTETLWRPDFWQALGKTRGWEVHDVVTSSAEYREWTGRWHRLIDHLAEGKDIESYFANL